MIRYEPLGSPWKTDEPFIFCVHHHDKFPNGDERMEPIKGREGREIGQDFSNKDGWNMYHGRYIPGFPYHPHKGFETITITERGVVDHTDSIGNGGRFGFGDVQWMTAGKGVEHSEMFPLVNKEGGNDLELFQIWMNLPKKHKNVEPSYKMLWHEDIPNLSIEDDDGLNTHLRIICGTYDHFKAPSPTVHSWANDIDNDVLIMTINVPKGGKFVLKPNEKGTHRALYFYEGKEATLKETRVPAYSKIYIDPSETLLIESTSGEAKFLLLQGKPINEPVVQYGPFVMNTEQEIHEAFKEYHEKGFGKWPWPRTEHIFPRGRKRFAIHRNGEEEVRE